MDARSARPVLLAFLVAAVALGACSLAILSPPPQVAPAPRERAAGYRPASLYAPHWEDGRFHNPWRRFPHGRGAVLRWWLAPNAYAEASEEPPRVPLVANDGSALAGRAGSAAITWVGHATFAVHDGENVFLTDPHFGERAFWPKRLHSPGVPIAAIPPDAFAVLSHNHYDHLDEWTVETLPDTVTWFVPLGHAAWFRERGRHRVVELDWWERARHGRWTVTCLPSQHWSRRLGMGRNEALWCSWLLDSGERRYYFAGDTGYFHGFREFARRFGPIDVAMLPIGGYAPRWFMSYQHMDPAEAWQAFRDLEARWMLPMHWGTFDLTDEPLDLPPRELARAVAEAEGDPSRIRLLAVGERWHLPDEPAGPSPPVQQSGAESPRSESGQAGTVNGG